MKTWGVSESFLMHFNVGGGVSFFTLFKIRYPRGKGKIERERERKREESIQR